MHAQHAQQAQHATANVSEDFFWPGDIAPAALAVTFAARVIDGRADGGYTLHAGGRPCAAQRAASCLLEPEAGDTVACWRVSDDETGDAIEARARVFITAVLTRAQSASACVSLAGDVELRTPTGALHIAAATTLAWTAPACKVDSDELRLRSRALHVACTAIDAVSAACSAAVGQLRLVGALCATVFDRETHHAQQHQRSVEGVDRLDANVIDHEARALMQLRGENLVANGSQLVKLRGAQVHIG